MYYFKNMAGKTCNEEVIEELTHAGIIPVYPVTVKHSEVKVSVVGVLGCWYDPEDIKVSLSQFRTLQEMDFLKSTEGFFRYTFSRAWTYWVCYGPVPLIVAKELYSTEVGKNFVRIDGDCTCPPPEDPHLRPYDGPHGTEGSAVYMYHIDTVEGLRLFVDKLKEYKLDQVPRQYKFS